MHEGNLSVDRVRPVTARDATRLLEWRNHPRVRRHMFTTEEITRVEHREWLRRNLADSCRLMLIYERAGTPLGFVGLRLDRHLHIADWGFYTAPEAPKGTGRMMTGCALDHAFRELALHKVCGQALETNQRSISLHVVLGFTQEGVLREQHFDGGRYLSVVCFGLLAPEWAATCDD